MAPKQPRARRLLRSWRERQSPPVSQRELGAELGKTGRLISLFETGKAELITPDCVFLHFRTRIPLKDFLTRRRIRHLNEAVEILQAGEK